MRTQHQTHESGGVFVSPFPSVYKRQIYMLLQFIIALAKTKVSCICINRSFSIYAYACNILHEKNAVIADLL